jgi:outer membrane protein assembly factor BamB
MPLVTPDVVVGMAGFHGSAIGVKPGGSGDVTATHRLWRVTNNPQRIGSGVIVGEHIYMANDNGMAQCIDLKTGKALWNERLSSKGCWASIVYADDKLYVTDLDGTTFVFAPKPEKLEVLARNAMKERTMASIAVVDGQLFLRTHENLYCIGKK